MTITKRSDAELQELTGDKQGELVHRIQMLAYKINQACFADVVVSYAPTTLQVKVNVYHSNEPLIDGAPFSLTVGNHSDLFLHRLKVVADQLQALLDRGGRPKGDAA
jgi:hypothetical protein